MFHPMKPETRKAFMWKLFLDQCANHSRLLHQLYERWATEGDRQYADDMWGSMLSDFGIVHGSEVSP